MRVILSGFKGSSGAIACFSLLLLSSCDCEKLQRVEKNPDPPIKKKPNAAVERAVPIEPSPQKLEPEVSEQSAELEFEEPDAFVRHCLLAEQKEGVDYVMKLYAEDVDYFGSERSASEVRSSIAEYRSKWPTRSERVTTTVFTRRTDENRWDVYFNTAFNYKAPERKDWMNGTKSHEFTVVRNKKSYLVTGRTSEYRHTIGPDGEKFPGEDLAEGDLSSAELRKKARSSIYPQTSEAVRLIVKVRKAELERNIEGVMSAYAPTVKYFGKKMTKEELYQHMVESFMKWPKIEDLQTSTFAGAMDGSPLLLVTFNSKFKKINELEGTWESGIMANAYVFSEVNGKMLIVEQAGKITNHKKSSQ